jgi:hypothetical protein
MFAGKGGVCRPPFFILKTAVVHEVDEENHADTKKKALRRFTTKNMPTVCHPEQREDTVIEVKQILRLLRLRSAQVAQNDIYWNYQGIVFVANRLTCRVNRLLYVTT